MAADDRERLVKVAIVGSEVEASILQDALRQEGVHSYVRSQTAAEPIGVPLVSSFEIFVFARDAKRARWVIGERP
ncbi:MAG TPA: DUF2007 domain-containing protein [Dehalococcoidia bacterium]|nr:DUF2007 domain-containing protein [Dehalococcoidia bacterium]